MKRCSAWVQGRSGRLLMRIWVSCLWGLVMAGCVGSGPGRPGDPSAGATAGASARSTCGDAASTGQVRLTWEQPSRNTDGTALQDLAGYRLRYGQTRGRYTSTVDVGLRTTYTMSGLRPGSTYYFAVVAYDIHGNESPLSDAVEVTVPPTAGRQPVLTHTPFVPGQQTRFEVSGIKPGDLVSFLFSASGQGNGPCSPDLGGLCMDVLAPQVFGETTAGEAGVASFAVSIPARAAVGTTLAIQAVVRPADGRGCALKTNVRTVTVQ